MCELLARLSRSAQEQVRQSVPNLVFVIVSVCVRLVLPRVLDLSQCPHSPWAKVNRCRALGHSRVE